MSDAKINDGGPAFPVPYNHEAAGISMRDWFAGQALAGWAAGRNKDTFTFDPARVAIGCYKYADAMLAARKEKP